MGGGIYGENVAIDLSMQWLWKEALGPLPGLSRLLPIQSPFVLAQRVLPHHGGPLNKGSLAWQGWGQNPKVAASADTNILEENLRKKHQQFFGRSSEFFACSVTECGRAQPGSCLTVVYQNRQPKPNQPHALGQKPSFQKNKHLGT